MSDPAPPPVTTPAGTKPDLTRVRRLTPANASVFLGTYSLLHCNVVDDRLYRGVFALRLFPIRYPNRYISLHYTDEEDKEREIGVIEELSAFSQDQQDLVRRSLGNQYYEQVISRVYDIRYEYGLLFFDVETQRGREQFVMPWHGDRAEDYGEKGKVLLDAYDNRFLIPDVEQLPTADQRRFTNYIYW